jgi:glycosyltransferase involved in cell wall biosynthesis
MKKIFIDCFNISSGGGLTHIKNLLSENSTNHVYLFASKDLLDEIDDNWLIKKFTHPLLNKSLIFRALWHLTLSKSSYKKFNCDIAFYPGGINFSGIKLFVTMSRNMLPFNWQEIIKYRSILFKIKLLVIRLSQISTFKRSSGLIFLNKFAEHSLEKYIGNNTLIKIIPHGSVPSIRSISNTRVMDEKNKNFLYVSHFSPYKNHLNLIKAIHKLVDSYGHKDINLTLVGSLDESYRDCKNYINSNSIEKYITITGAVPQNLLADYYNSCDVFIFSSTCENYPNILNEISDYNFDVICSYFQPMPTLLKDNSLYFNPTIIDDIVKVILFYLTDANVLNEALPNNNKKFVPTSWATCSSNTFKFLDEVIKENVC